LIEAIQGTVPIYQATVSPRQQAHFLHKIFVNSVCK
jgi:hypothetical protein